MTQTVLLVNPPIYDFAAYDFFNKPLGLLYLAAFLRQNGYEVRLIDALDRNHPALTNEKLYENHSVAQPKTKPNGTGKYHSEIIECPACLEHIPRHYRRYGLPADLLTDLLESEKKENPPIAVLVTSMMTYWYPAVADTIRLIRQVLSDVPIGLGGVYARLMPDHAAKVCQPDKLFTGSNITAVLKWLDEIAQKKHDYNQLTDEFVAWPPPVYELYHQLDYLTLITSLGCPFHCDYCASRNLQPQLRQLAPHQFVEQLTSLLPLLKQKQKRLNAAFMDDALLARADNHIIPILKQTANLQLPLYFHCPNGLHCRFISPEMAELMYANRFEMIRLSYESADAAGPWQRASDDKISDQDLVQAVANLEKAGFQRRNLETYILTGLPGQTMAEIKQSADFVHNLGVKVRLCQYSPIPGTRLFDVSCRQYGVDLTEPLLHNNTILPSIDRRVSPADFQQFKDHIQQMNRSLG
ncbi:B12-binding domain-containing radical SAM protein [Planctomycetota bacterium]